MPQNITLGADAAGDMQCVDFMIKSRMRFFGLMLFLYYVGVFSADFPSEQKTSAHAYVHYPKELEFFDENLNKPVTCHRYGEGLPAIYYSTFHRFCLNRDKSRMQIYHYVVAGQREDGGERWSFIFNEGGVDIFYRAAGILSLDLENQTRSVKAHITSHQKTYHYDVGAHAPVRRWFCNMSCCKSFSQTFGDKGYVFQVLPILNNKKMDLQIVMLCGAHPILTLRGTQLLKNAPFASDGRVQSTERLIRRVMMEDLQKRTELSKKNLEKCVVAKRKYEQSSGGSVEAQVASKMICSSLRSHKVTIFYRDNLDGDRETLIMQVLFEGIALNMLAQRFANTLLFSMVYKNLYDSVAAVFDVGTGPIHIEGEERGDENNRRVYFDILIKGESVGALSAKLIDSCLIQTQAFDAQEVMPARGWSVSMIKGVICAKSIECVSRLAFNYSGVPVARMLGKGRVEILSLNTEDRKLYGASRFIIFERNGYVLLQHEVMKRKQYAVKQEVCQVKLSAPFDVDSLVVFLDKSTYSSEFRWKDLSFCMAPSAIKGNIDFTLFYGDSVYCNGMLPTPGDHSTFLLFKGYSDAWTHLYYFFGWLKTPRCSLIHMLFNDGSCEPISWDNERVSQKSTILKISGASESKTLEPVYTYFECQDRYIWNIVYAGEEHPAYFSLQHARDNSVLRPTHYGAQWCNNRIEMFFAHQPPTGGECVVLGYLYADGGSVDSRGIFRECPEPYSISFEIEKPGGREHPIFWLAPRENRFH